jgi:hypothetical protein
MFQGSIIATCCAVVNATLRYLHSRQGAIARVMRESTVRRPPSRVLRCCRTGVEFGARMISIDHKQIKLQIWDTVCLLPTSTIISSDRRPDLGPLTPRLHHDANAPADITGDI